MWEKENVNGYVVSVKEMGRLEVSRFLSDLGELKSLCEKVIYLYYWGMTRKFCCQKKNLSSYILVTLYLSHQYKSVVLFFSKFVFDIEINFKIFCTSYMLLQKHYAFVSPFYRFICTDLSLGLLFAGCNWGVVFTCQERWSS